MSNILVSFEKNKLESYTDFRIKTAYETSEFKLKERGVSFPSLQLNLFFGGQEHLVEIATPMFSIFKDSQFKNYMIWDDLYKSQPTQSYRVINSFSLYLFEVFNNSSGIPLKPIILDLSDSRNPRFVFDSDIMGCANCTYRDEFILSSGLNLNQRDKVSHLPYKKLEEFLKAKGYTKNIEDGFEISHFMALKEIYTGLKEIL